mgnify:CR=1 FL=1
MRIDVLRLRVRRHHAGGLPVRRRAVLRPVGLLPVGRLPIRRLSVLLRLLTLQKHTAYLSYKFDTLEAMLKAQLRIARLQISSECYGFDPYYNAGFENISIRDIAERVAAVVPAEIVVTPSNDPRSYRQLQALSLREVTATVPAMRCERTEICIS